MIIKMRSFRPCVYLLKRRNKVVYVGQSRNIFMRISGHSDKQFDEMEIIKTKPKSLNRIEKLLIGKHRPKYNVKHNPDMDLSLAASNQAYLEVSRRLEAKSKNNLI